MQNLRRTSTKAQPFLNAVDYSAEVSRPVSAHTSSKEPHSHHSECCASDRILFGFSASFAGGGSNWLQECVLVRVRWQLRQNTFSSRSLAHFLALLSQAQHSFSFLRSLASGTPLKNFLENRPPASICLWLLCASSSPEL